MTEQPPQEPFEPYLPGPEGGEQSHPATYGAPQQVPPPWAVSTAPDAGVPSSYGYRQAQQDHPQAALILVLGIVSVFFSPVGPVAWVLGARAKKEIEASSGRLGGMSQVMIGYVLGIVMSVLMALVLVLAILFFVVILVVAVAAGS